MVSSDRQSLMAINTGDTGGVAARAGFEAQPGADTLLGLDGSVTKTPGAILAVD
jgi:hypothetical protein